MQKMAALGLRASRRHQKVAIALNACITLEGMENRSRSAQIKFWVTPAVKREIQDRARSAASLGDYLERAALQRPADPDKADLLAALSTLRAIRARIKPASTIDVKRAVFELRRLGRMQKYLYSEAKAPLDRIDRVAKELIMAIARVESAVTLALAPPPAETLTAQVLVRLEMAIRTLSEALGYESE